MKGREGVGWVGEDGGRGRERGRGGDFFVPSYPFFTWGGAGEGVRDVRSDGGGGGRGGDENYSPGTPRPLPPLPLLLRGRASCFLWLGGGGGGKRRSLGGRGHRHGSFVVFIVV